MLLLVFVSLWESLLRLLLFAFSCSLLDRKLIVSRHRKIEKAEMAEESLRPELRGVVKPPKQRRQTETKKPEIANGGEDKETETEGGKRMKQGREEEHDDEDNHTQKRQPSTSKNRPGKLPC